MEIISGTIDFRITEDTVLAIGKFDGYHNGHGLIVDTMMAYQLQGYKTVILTFDTPPAGLILHGDKRVLTTNAEKRILLEEAGVDYLIEFPFYEKTASISAEEFIEEYIVDRINAKAVVVGTDCTFGHRARGNAAMLKYFGKHFGFSVEIVEKLRDEEREISSTYLRDLVIEGDVRKICRLARFPYFVNGIFAHGFGEGQKFGMPFCVMNVGIEKLLPKDGVYLSRVIYEEEYYPSLTFVSNKKRALENYLYGGNRKIGSVPVSVVFFEKMRDAMEFKSPEHMRKQITRDIFEGEKWQKEHRNFSI